MPPVDDPVLAPPIQIPRSVVLGALTIGAIMLFTVGWFILPIAVSFGYAFLPSIETTVEADAVRAGDSIRVTGTTNLPDDAVLGWSVGEAGGDGPELSGTVPVRGGHFTIEADGRSLPEEGLQVWLSFGVGWEVDQPVNVVLVYGPGGERLAGDDVWTDSGDTLLEVAVPVRSDGLEPVIVSPAP